MLPFSKPNPWKLYAIAAALLILVGATAIIYGIALLLSNINQTNTTAPVKLTQWSGYIVASDMQNRSAVVSSVSASWTVPAIKVSADDTFSSVWVGIGGYGEKILIQAGTHQECANGELSYFAWYELLPDYLKRITNINVQPGDTVAASVNLISTNTWSIEVSDVTSSEHFQKTVTYNASRLSAEWIVERPNVNGTTSTLADFGNVTFSGCEATLQGRTGPISNFSYAQLLMVSSKDVPLVSVSSLNDDGSSFTVSYLQPSSADSQNIDLNVHSAVVLSKFCCGDTFPFRARKTAFGF